MTGNDYKFLGSIVKTRGISGEVVIRSKIPVKDIKKNLKSLMIKIDGLLVPFSIISWQFLSEKEIIAVFRDIDSKTKSEILKDRDVFVPESDISDTIIGSDLHNLSGYKVSDIKIGELGKATGILEVPGNDLLKVKYGEKEILLPIQEGLIREIDSKRKRIIVDLPEGFLEI